MFVVSERLVFMRVLILDDLWQQQVCFKTTLRGISTVFLAKCGLLIIIFVVIVLYKLIVGVATVSETSADVVLTSTAYIWLCIYGESFVQFFQTCQQLISRGWID